MFKKMHDVYDSFRLDEETRQEALDNILAAVREEPEKKPLRLRWSVRKTVAAACAVMVLTFGTVAYAEGWFGLRELSTGRSDMEYTVYDEDGGEHRNAYQAEPIALSGFKGSPEHRAAAEWNEYWWDYVWEHEIPNEPGESNGYYDIYDCYLPEMEAKLDEILEKYDLKPHMNEKDYYDIQELCGAIGIETIFRDNKEALSGPGRGWGYAYDDGSFHYEGSFRNGVDEPIDFQMSRNMYGFFEDSMINIRDSSRYTEWEYDTGNGVHITIAEAREAWTDEYGEDIDPRAFAIIARPESMVIVSINARLTETWYEANGETYASEVDGEIVTKGDIAELNIPPESITVHHTWELPSREEIEVLLEDLHAENIP